MKMEQMKEGPDEKTILVEDKLRKVKYQYLLSQNLEIKINKSFTSK